MKHLLDIPCDEMQANCERFNLFNDTSFHPRSEKKEYLMCLNSQGKNVIINHFWKLAIKSLDSSV